MLKTTDSETPIFDALVAEHENTLPLVHLSSALRGGPERADGSFDRTLGLDPVIAPAEDAAPLPRRRAG